MMVWEWDSEDHPEVVRVDGVSYRIGELDGKVAWWFLKDNGRKP